MDMHLLFQDGHIITTIIIMTIIIIIIIIIIIATIIGSNKAAFPPSSASVKAYASKTVSTDFLRQPTVPSPRPSTTVSESR